VTLVCRTLDLHAVDAHLEPEDAKTTGPNILAFDVEHRTRGDVQLGKVDAIGRVDLDLGDLHVDGEDGTLTQSESDRCAANRAQPDHSQRRVSHVAVSPCRAPFQAAARASEALMNYPRDRWHGNRPSSKQCCESATRIIPSAA
jgi:hypothetical protein